MCDHLLDAVELARLEEGERRLVGACVPGETVNQYTALQLRNQREGGNLRREVIVIGARLEEREEQKVARERMEVLDSPEHPQ